MVTIVATTTNGAAHWKNLAKLIPASRSYDDVWNGTDQSQQTSDIRQQPFHQQESKQKV